MLPVNDNTYKLMHNLLRDASGDVVRFHTDSHDFPTKLGCLFGAVFINSFLDLTAFRCIVREAFTKSGASFEALDAIQIAIGEAGMNTIAHANGGVIEVFYDDKQVQVWISDKGKGISYDILPQAVLVPGWSSADTLGQGFWLILNTAKEVHLQTDQRGTIIAIVVDIK